MATSIAELQGAIGATAAGGLRDVLRRLWGRWDGRVGFLMLAFFVVMAIVGQIAVTSIPTGATASSVFQPPSLAHPLGTDELGRSVLSELVAGAWVSLIVGLGATAISIVIGTAVGLIAGYKRGPIDGFLSGATDLMLTVPQLPLLIVLAAVVGQGLGKIILVIGLTGWPTTARLIRSEVLSLRERGFVLRLRAVGVRTWRVMIVHLLPHLSALVVANTMLVTAIAILNEATLSFLGLGDPTRPSWGLMLQTAFTSGAASRGAEWYLAPPGICILLLVLSFVLIGHALTAVLRVERRAGVA
jgi:peptide/nickel transport system permease protein